jgi:hypothetical protein
MTEEPPIHASKNRLEGSLAETPLKELLDPCRRHGLTGTIRIEAREGRGVLHLRAGVVDHASFGLLVGDAAVIRMSLLREGSYHVEQRLPDLSGRLGPAAALESDATKVPLVAVMRHCEQNALSGTITVIGGFDRAEIRYRSGELVEVRLNGEPDADALPRVVRWPDARYRLVLEPLSKDIAGWPKVSREPTVPFKIGAVPVPPARMPEGTGRAAAITPAVGLPVTPPAQKLAPQAPAPVARPPAPIPARAPAQPPPIPVDAPPRRRARTVPPPPPVPRRAQTVPPVPVAAAAAREPDPLTTPLFTPVPEGMRVTHPLSVAPAAPPARPRAATQRGLPEAVVTAEPAVPVPVDDDDGPAGSGPVPLARASSQLPLPRAESVRPLPRAATTRPLPRASSQIPVAAAPAEPPTPPTRATSQGDLWAAPYSPSKRHRLPSVGTRPTAPVPPPAAAPAARAVPYPGRLDTAALESAAAELRPSRVSTALLILFMLIGAAVLGVGLGVIGNP